ncbi:MAG: hypothetical protein ACTSX7_11755 [Alphaproteobacteria bacterium]
MISDLMTILGGLNLPLDLSAQAVPEDPDVLRLPGAHVDAMGLVDL